MHLTPADYIIHLLGGVRNAARELKYSPSAVSRWRTTGGEIPTKARKIILKYAHHNHLDVTPYHLEFGAKIRSK